MGKNLDISEVKFACIACVVAVTAVISGSDIHPWSSIRISRLKFHKCKNNSKLNEKTV